MSVIDIWKVCNGKAHIGFLEETAWRLVETQEITATRKLVDSLDEQIILEEILEASKPPVFQEYIHYHPLLYTPFRYPPLKYGSRFGSRMELALWYGSLQLTTAMAEKAFYKLNFLRASDAQFDFVEERLTAFSVQVKTAQGIKLSALPFAKYQEIISSKVSYITSQALGSVMREENIDAFTFVSARDQNTANNIALFTPKAFAQQKPNMQSFQSWQCIVNREAVEFVRSSTITAENQCFSLNQFVVNGVLPFLAA